jgi:signal peptidase I
MPKNKSESAAPRPQATKSSKASSSWMSGGAIREVVESIVVAFVLAFLFRTFEAEAFVIPTGSMAPTLMGRHKDVACQKCGYHFQVSASEEVDPNTNRPTGASVRGATCPMCGYTMDLGLPPQKSPYQSFNGDRILVAKFAYQIADPHRFDVAVFKYPGKAQTNYIKRLVGLPKETLKIHHGDIFVKPDGDSEFTIARKSPEKVLAVMRPVYDNDSVLTQWIDRGWPSRWGASDASGGWQPSADWKSFETDGTARGDTWLRYRHFVATHADWERMCAGDRLKPPPSGQLITDYVAYNSEVSDPSGGRDMRGEPARYNANRFDACDGYPPAQKLGLHWVGDLVVRSTLEAPGESGQVVFELVRGGRHFRCRLDLAEGTARLEIADNPRFQPSATVAVRGKHEITFANVDRQLLLWVDGHSVAFDGPTGYDALDGESPQDDLPTAADLEPAGIAASGGAAVRVSHLKIFRDLYYIAEKSTWATRATTRPSEVMSDFPGEVFARMFDPDLTDADSRLRSFFSDPKNWDVFEQRRTVDFHLGADQFMMCGDNSAASKDSRVWSADSDAIPFYVSRDLLVGKALFIYWPHSWDKIPGIGLWFPFFPNFARMGFVR